MKVKRRLKKENKQRNIDDKKQGKNRKVYEDQDKVEERL